MTEAAVAPTPTDGAQLLGGLVSDVIDRATVLGRTDLCETLHHRLQASLSADPVRVVIAGEVKRGKTSLVNALLGMPDLLPVGEDVCTATYALVEHADGPRAEVTFVDGEVTAIPVSSLDEWASVIGPEVREGHVQSVRVGLASPLLQRGLVLVDTPGVNGRLRGHDELTRTALRMADVVLFCVDCDTEITAPEVEFLGSIAAQVQRVTVVATKSDLAGWEHIVTRDREVLERSLPSLRFDLLAVSNTVKRRADLELRAGNREVAQDLFGHSGIGSLLDVLRLAVDRRIETRSLNLLHAAVVAAGELVRDVEARRGVASAEGTFATLRDAKARVQDVAAATVHIEQHVRAAFERLRDELTDEIRRQASAFDRELDAPGNPRPDLDAVRIELQSRLDALGADAHRRLVEGVLGIVESTNQQLQQRQLAGMLDDFRAELPPERRGSLLEPRQPVGPTFGEQLVGYLPAVYAPAAIGQLLIAAGAASVAGAVLPIIGLPLIGASIAVRHAAEQRRRDRQAARDLVRANLQAVLQHPDGLAGSVQSTIRAVREQLLSVLRTRIDRRATLLRSEFEQLVQLNAAQGAARERDRRKITRQLADLQSLQRRLAAIDRSITESLKDAS